MTDHNDPVFRRLSQSLFEPLQLGFGILIHSIGICVGLFPVFVNQRSGVEKYHLDSCPVIFKGLGVISRRHLPTAGYAGIVDNRLSVAAIFMVAADGIPVHHKLRVVVDKLIVRHPQGICHTLYTAVVMCVPKCKNSIGSYLFCNSAHRRCNRLLVIVAITSEV